MPRLPGGDSPQQGQADQPPLIQDQQPSQPARQHPSHPQQRDRNEQRGEANQPRDLIHPGQQPNQVAVDPGERRQVLRGLIDLPHLGFQSPQRALQIPSGNQRLSIDGNQVRHFRNIGGRLVAPVHSLGGEELVV